MFIQPEFDEFDNQALYQGPEVMAPGFSFGQIVAMGMGFLLFSLLFAFWGKSRAEDHNVHPVIGFLMGFFFAWVGVMLVPIFKSDRVFAEKRGRMNVGQPTGGNPIYGHGTSFQPPAQPLQHDQQPAQPLQHDQQPAQGQQYPMQQAPIPQQPQQGQPYPVQQQSQQPFPQPPNHTQAAPPPPAQPPTMLVADEQGYVECPTCHARSKSDRKSCMSCGTRFPDVYDPNFKQ
ncbi:MAG: hypothetical protein ACYTDT_02895 [Planctomycetota bacterium]|jgi:hypothetical protein